MASNLLGGETPATLRQFVTQTRVSFPIAWDSKSYRLFRAAAGGGIAPFPLDVVIDRDGRIAYVSREYDARALRSVVNKLLSTNE